MNGEEEISNCRKNERKCNKKQQSKTQREDLALLCGVKQQSYDWVPGPTIKQQLQEAVVKVWQSISKAELQYLVRSMGATLPRVINCKEF